MGGALSDELAQAEGRIRVTGSGEFLSACLISREKCAQAEYVTYRGPFVSPDELPEMYAGVDLVWGAYLHGESNARWARSNRYFEAGYFGKPIFAQKGTREGDAVAERAPA